MANDGDQDAAKWADKLVRRGASAAVLGEIHAAVRDIQVITYPQLDPRLK
jgi:hypothetical protein